MEIRGIRIEISTLTKPLVAAASNVVSCAGISQLPYFSSPCQSNLHPSGKLHSAHAGSSPA
jgi:hypothetical protein